ncbi:glycoside hydrolase family 95 protein [Niabella insulamsoli]|uniref:glycoside hydrolase family 95 protein n=1 Tax=Niabella insulamsoli TaxID=3144874 RepID=UPI0031FCF4FE
MIKYLFQKIEVPKTILALALSLVAEAAAAQDLQLWYDQPASKWVEALPLGNGRLGAMVFGGVEEDRIQFNEETLWTGYPRNYNKADAYTYLDSIRNLLFEGKQKEAENLAGQEFMGLKSRDGHQDAWVAKVKSILKLKENPSLQDYNDASWKTMRVPEYDGWEAVGFEGMDGAVWFRREFELPAAWRGKDLKLDINKMANHDFTYVNGSLIGAQHNDDARDYIIPANTLKPGKNSIAILILNFGGKGGILGYKDAQNPIGIYPADGDAKMKQSLNGQWKYFIQDSDVPAVGQYQASYQPFGDLSFSFNVDKKALRQYKRTLDLRTAVATTSYEYDGVHYQRKYLASAVDQTIATHFAADKKGRISFTAALSSPHKDAVLSATDRNTISLQVKVKDGALKGVSYLTITTIGGSMSVINNKLVVKNADEATAYLTANTNYKNYKDITAEPAALALRTLHQLKNKEWAAVKQAHINDYQNLFNSFSLSFGKATPSSLKLTTDQRLEQFATANDPAFLALYVQYGRYLLISSSRPGTRPANLQGIWNDLLSPPWGSKYTTNINAEMNYWPADLLNVSAMQQPLFQMIKELSVTGRQTAKSYYNAPGWVLHHNTDLWRGTAPINASNHGIWVTGGAWLCDHLWQHYLFHKNQKFLKDTAYPVMKEAALFFKSFLIKDPETGFLISTPSNSPEQGGLVAGPTMDHQIIRNLFKAVASASEILNVDAGLRKELLAKYEQIAPNCIGRYGQLQEWMQDIDDTTNKHRHVSHLWAVYPGNEINWASTPDLMKAARQSLIYRGDAATGWSLGWKINLWARFKDGDHTYKLIQMLLSPAGSGAGSYPNLFDAHPPFQIDGNFGGAAGVGEMLLQSHTGDIELLPALPSSLPEGEVKGLLARGGFEINLQWLEGELQSVAVTSHAGQPLTIRYKNEKVSVKTEKGKTYQFDAKLQAL